MAQVLRDADPRLTVLRSGPHPEAGGLVVAIDMEHAAPLAERLARVSGEQPEIVTSETPGASERIARFAAGSGRWLVSVLMVSEGVDVPRLRVGVYATTARTELFFRQVVGRFVRRTPTPREQMSHLFLASDPRLKALAAQVEEERNHALEQEAAGEAVAEQRERAEASEAFRALWSSARRDDDVLQTTAPGDALQLFAAAGPAAPPAALAAFTTTAAAPVARGGRVRPRAPRAPARRAPRARRRRLPPHGRGAPRDPRPHQPRDRRRLDRGRERRPTQARRPPARAAGSRSGAAAVRSDAPARRPTPSSRCFPTWPDGTVTVLSTGGGAPHAIPVSTAVRSGPRHVHFALALRRESLARLREDPRCALTVLAKGVAVTALGTATMVEEARAGRLRPPRRGGGPGPRPADLRARGRRPLALDRRRRRARRRGEPRSAAEKKKKKKKKNSGAARPP